MLTGPQGELPIIPLYWYTYTNLERESVKDTFHINLLDQFDLSKVVIRGGLSEVEHGCRGSPSPAGTISPQKPWPPTAFAALFGQSRSCCDC